MYHYFKIVINTIIVITIITIIIIIITITTMMRPLHQKKKHELNNRQGIQ